MKTNWAKIIFFIIAATILSACLSICCIAEITNDLTNTAIDEDCILTLNDATVETSEEGTQVLRINGVYTNNNQMPYYAACSFAVRAFQHDIELTEVSDINGSESALIREIKNGASLEVCYVFELSDMSEVEVLIGEPTAEQTTIGKAVYTLTE